MNKNNKQPARRLKTLITHLTAMIAVVVIVIFITFRWINRYTEHGVAIMVPDITGMQQQEALDELAQHHLVGMVSDHIYIQGVPAGEITAYLVIGDVADPVEFSVFAAADKA